MLEAHEARQELLAGVCPKGDFSSLMKVALRRGALQSLLVFFMAKLRQEFERNKASILRKRAEDFPLSRANLSCWVYAPFRFQQLSQSDLAIFAVDDLSPPMLPACSGDSRFLASPRDFLERVHYIHGDAAMEFAAEADLICSFRAAALKYLGVEDEKRKLELSKLRQDALTDFVAQKDALPQTMVVVSCVLYVLRKNFQNVDPATLFCSPLKSGTAGKVCVLGNRFSVGKTLFGTLGEALDAVAEITPYIPSGLVPVKVEEYLGCL